MIVLLKVVLSNVSTLVAQTNAPNGVQNPFDMEQNISPGAGMPVHNLNLFKLLQQEKSNIANGHRAENEQQKLPALEELNLVRLREITSKAVAGIILMLLKWFKLSRKSFVDCEPSKWTNVHQIFSNSSISPSCCWTQITCHWLSSTLPTKTSTELSIRRTTVKLSSKHEFIRFSELSFTDLASSASATSTPAAFPLLHLPSSTPPPPPLPPAKTKLNLHQSHEPVAALLSSLHHPHQAPPHPHLAGPKSTN